MVTPARSTKASPGGSRVSVAPITSPGVSSLPGMSLSECIAACNAPETTALRISATKAPPLPPCCSSLLVWSESPDVSNLTISTSRSATDAVRRRAISSVCASAITLLRVPIRMRVTAIQVPFDAAKSSRQIFGPEDRASRRRNANACKARPTPALPRILQDHVGGFFGDHDRGSVGIARHQVRHDRGIDHTQALDAAHPKPLIDHRQRIVAHTAGRGRMIDRAAGPAAEVQQVLVAGHLRSRIDLFDRIGLERRRSQDLAQDLEAFDE